MLTDFPKHLVREALEASLDEMTPSMLIKDERPEIVVDLLKELVRNGLIAIFDEKLKNYIGVNDTRWEFVLLRNDNFIEQTNLTLEFLNKNIW